MTARLDGPGAHDHAEPYREGSLSGRPRAVIVGLGRYFAKIRSGLLRQFDPVALIDVQYPHIVEDLVGAVEAADPDVVLLLTPNNLHAGQVVDLARLRCTVFVEKPLATTAAGLEAVRRSLVVNPRLYCSDFYPDVRAVPLKAWAGTPPAWANDAVRTAGDLELWREGPAALGPLLSAESRLWEGAGEAATFAGREWLWDPTHGGVTWDLAYHLLTLWYDLRTEPLALQEARLRTAAGAPFTAETEAHLDLTTPSGLPVTIHVKKYHDGPNERWLRLHGERGTAIMRFDASNSLTVEAQGRRCSGELRGDYYAMVATAFASYLRADRGIPHGFEAAASAVAVVLHAKQHQP